MERKRSGSSYLMIGAGLALLATLIVIWQLVSYARTAPVEYQFSIIVAVLALVGTLWTGAITFAGLLLKESVDRRSAELQADSERRLRMDTALKAVELMSKATGAGAQDSREAAILVIASLNQPRLAIRLGEQYWNTEKISTPTFVQIVNACLESDDDVAKAAAAAALKINYAKLCSSPQKIEFPEAYCLKWSGDLPAEAKYDLVEALLLAMLSQEFSYWSKGVLNWIVYFLYKLSMNDPDSFFRSGAARYLIQLCALMPEGPEARILPPDRGQMSYGEMCEEAEALIARLDSGIRDDDRELLNQMSSWTEPRPDRITAQAETAALRPPHRPVDRAATRASRPSRRVRSGGSAPPDPPAPRPRRPAKT